MRILFTTTRGAGHFGPLVPFIRACSRAGHDVLVGGVPRVAPLAERAGFAFRALPVAPEDEVAALWEPVFSLPAKEQDAHVVREIFAGCHARAALLGTLALVDEWGAELVVHESSEFSGPVAAERRGVPHATVGAYLVARNDDLSAEVAAPRVDELRAGVGLEPDPRGERIRRAPLLTQAPRSLDDPPGATICEAVRFREERPSSSPPLPFPSPPLWGGSDEPLVYLSFGTEVPTMDFFPGLYQAAIGALADLPVRVLVTIGDTRDPAELGPLPQTAHVERWMPQGAVMPHAAAMIGHGGSGSSLTALTWGVPMALMPLFADQGTNAGRVAEAGAAVVLEGGPPAAAGLGKAVRSLLSEARYRQGAERIRDEIAALPPIDESVEVLTALGA
jgi:hypothetical protein